MPSPLPFLDVGPVLAWGVLVTAIAAVGMLLVSPRVLGWLPEPHDDPEAPHYASLATPTFVIVVAALSGVATGLAVSRTTPQLWLAWSALTTANVLACAIDARTTWLPARLSHAGWFVALAGTLLACGVDGSWWPLAAAAAGAVVVGGFFHLVWRFTGQLGYGDVRLAATIGAVTALSSASMVAWALLTGTLLGAVTGIVERARGRRGGFPYGPGLLAGAFVALLLPWA